MCDPNMLRGAQQQRPPIGAQPDYGNRPDGTAKGKGWMGELKRPDGGVSTELTVRVDLDGQGRDIPLIVPTLNKKEVEQLLSVPDGKKPWDVIKNYGDIERKAVEHARIRIKEGKSPYAD